MSLLLPVNLLWGVFQTSPVAVIVGFFLGSFLVPLFAAAEEVGDVNASAKQQLSLNKRRSARAHVCSYIYPCISLTINCLLQIVNFQEDMRNLRNIVGGGLIGMMSGAGLMFLFTWNKLARPSR